MRLSSIVREAGVNIVSRVTRAGLLTLVFAVAIGALACADVATVAALDHQAAHFQAVGSTTIIYKAPERVDGARCEALSTVRGVRAAGAIRTSATDVTALALPSSTIPTFEVSPNFAGFTALDASGQALAGVAVSAEVASSLSLRVGQSVALEQGSPTVQSIYQYPEDGRRAGMGYAVLMPVDTRKAFDECWVEAWPQSDQIMNLLPTALTSGAMLADERPPQVSQLNATLGIHFDGAALFAGRTSQFAVFAAILCGLALGFLAVWIRRLELAAARHSGLRLGAQSLQMVFETLSWVSAGVLFSGVAIVALALREQPANPGSLIFMGLHVLAGAAPAALAGALLAVMVIREKDLFRYFKNR